MKTREHAPSGEPKEKTGNIERLKNFLLRAAPLWIDGTDFSAFNYGDESQDHSMAGRSSIISSAAGSAVIDWRTGAWRFEKPHMPIVNVSHVTEFDKVRINLTFDEVRKAIEDINEFFKWSA